MPAYYKKFASLLNVHLLGGDELKLGQVAKRMQHLDSPSSLYKYAEGYNTFPPDLIPDLINATGERAFGDFCVAGTKWALTLRPGHSDDSKPLAIEALDVGVAVGQLNALVTQAIEDGRLSEPEVRRIETVINKAMDELEQVRQKVLEQRK